MRASLLLSVQYLNREGQHLFAWLGVVAEDAVIIPRMAATVWSEDEEAAAKHLRALSRVGLLSQKVSGYSIHDLMHDLARELLTAAEPSERMGNLPGLGLIFQDATRQFLGRYKNENEG